MANEFVVRNGLLALDNSVISGSLTVTGGITGSFSGTGSYAAFALSSSNSLTSSFAFQAANAASASFATSAATATTASHAVNAVTASFATVSANASSASFASNAANATTASHALNAVTSSFATFASTAASASFASNTSTAASASFATNASTAASASFATNAANATTASHAVNAVTASHALNAVTASHALNAVTASYIRLAASASNALSASYALNASNATSASYSNFAISSSFASNAANASTASFAAFASTASNAQTLAPGTTVSASNVYVSNNLFVAGTASFGFLQTVTGSAVIIGEQYIVLNADTPISQFAGIQIYDTGSATTASFEWNGVGDYWIGVEETGQSYGFLTGVTSSKGNEIFPVLNKLVKGTGYHGLQDSSISDNGSIVSVNSNTQITGSLIVSAGVTANLTGTSSFATSASYAGNASNATSASFATSAANATTASHAVNAVSTSFATTATAVVATVTGTNSTELVRGNMADNDQFRILVGGTGTNAGYAEIATADDGTEPIHVRQYTGVFSSLTRTATLLDGSGNTSFPGTVSATFSGNLTGTATSASHAVFAVTSSHAINAVTASFALNSQNAFVQGGNSFGAQALLGTNDAQNLAFETNGTVRMVISGSGGQVGIGTTLASQTTASILNLKANIADGNQLYIIQENDDRGWKFKAKNSGHLFIQSSYVGVNTDLFTILYDTGNVGINSTSPGYKLDVNGGAADTTIAAQTTGQNPVRLRLKNEERDFILTNNPVDNLLSFNYDGTNRFQFDTTNQWFNSGNVGIGTTSPVTKLQVDSALGVDVISISDAAGAVRLALGQESSYTGNYIDSKNIDFKIKTYLSGGSGGNIIFQTGTGSVSEKVRINGAGNVGIGTTGPLTRLHVSGGNSTLHGVIVGDDQTYGSPYKVVAFGNNADGNNRIFAATNTADGMYFASATGQGFRFRPNGGTSNLVVIESNGSVGIGTTAPANKLSVNGNISSTSGNLHTLRGRVAFSSTANDANHSIYNNYLDIDGEGIWDGMKFNVYAGASFRIGGYEAPTTILYITSSGVGIGTTLPSTKFHVSEGQILVSYTNSGTNSAAAALRINNVGSQSTIYFTFSNNAKGSIRVDSTGNMILNSTSSNFYFNNDFGTSTDLSFINTSTTFMVAKNGGSVYFPNGNVGINTTSPIAKLQLTYGSGSNGVAISYNNAGGDAGTALLVNSQTNDNTSYIVKFGSLNDGYRMAILGNGSVGIGTTVPSSKLHVYGGDILILDALGYGGRVKGYDDHHSIHFRENNKNAINYYEYGGNLAGGDKGHRFLTGGVSSSQALRFNVCDDASYFSTPLLIQTGVTSSEATLLLGAKDINEGGHMIFQKGTNYQSASHFDNFQNKLRIMKGTDANSQIVQFILQHEDNYVGIGTAGPTGLLHLYGSDTAFRIQNSGTGNMQFGQWDGSNNRIQSSGRDFALYQTDTNNITLWTNSTERARITGAGNILINTSSFSSPSLFNIKAAGSDGNQIYICQSNDDRGWRFKAKTDGHFYLQSSYIAATTDRFMIQYDTGNVGIGTTSPTAKLHIEGNNIVVNTENSAQGKSLYFRYSDGATIQSDSYLRFNTGGSPTEKVRIEAGGNVGINTTIPASKLTIYEGDIRLSKQHVISDSGTWKANINFTDEVDRLGARITGERTAWDGAPMGLGFDTGGVGSVTRRMTITSGGSVGIGTTSPATLLNIEGNDVDAIQLRIKNNNLANGNKYLALFVAGTTGYSVSGWANSSVIESAAGTNSNFVLGNYEDGPIIFQTNNRSEKVRITSGGNVGIGTTAPLANFDVRSSLNSGTAPTVYLSHNAGFGQISALDPFHSLILRGIPSGSTGYGVTAGDQMSFVEYGGDFRFYRKDGSLTLLGRLNEGTFTVTGDVVAYGSPSDVSLKTNIQPLEGALDKVTKLQGVSFTWKEDTETNQMTGIKDDIGFIAQQVQEVIPELVRKNDNGLLSLRDKGITALLVEAIKEQQKQIDELKYLLQTQNK